MTDKKITHITSNEDVFPSRLVSDTPNLCGNFERPAIGFYFYVVIPENKNMCESCLRIYQEKSTEERERYLPK